MCNIIHKSYPLYEVFGNYLFIDDFYETPKYELCNQ